MKKVIGGLAILSLFALGQATRAEEAPAQEQQVYMINSQTQEVILVNAVGDVTAVDQADLQDLSTPSTTVSNYSGIGGGVHIGPIGGGVHIGRRGIRGGAHVGPIGGGFWGGGRWHRGRWHRRHGRWAGDWAPYAE